MIIKAIRNIQEFPVVQRKLRTRVATCVRVCKTSDSSNNWLLQFNDTEGGESTSGEESKIMTNE